MLTIQNVDKIKDYEITNGKFTYYIDGVKSVGNNYVFSMSHRLTGSTGQFTLDRLTNELQWETYSPVSLGPICMQSPHLLLVEAFKSALPDTHIEFWIVDIRNETVIMKSIC